jgi:dihydropteroate synthase
MGIVNITPNSFSDGGRYFDATKAIEHALRLRAEGADLVDVGGESTRPHAEPVSEQAELERVMPVIEALVREKVPVSIDTLKPAVMRAAIEAGVAVVNDVNGLRAPGAVEAVAGTGVGLCIMHMQGTPMTMQESPQYDDVVAEVGAFLLERAEVLENAGVARERIVLDPGFGFGKSLEHNRELFRAIPRLAALGYALLIGVSRKRMIGDFTGRGIEERVAGSVAAALLAAQNGASVLRVHDVRETVDALNVWVNLRTGNAD